jgi:hypothetical protein
MATATLQSPVIHARNLNGVWVLRNSANKLVVDRVGSGVILLGFTSEEGAQLHIGSDFLSSEFWDLARLRKATDWVILDNGGWVKTAELGGPADSRAVPAEAPKLRMSKEPERVVEVDTNRRKPAVYKGGGRSLTERTLDILNQCGYLFVDNDDRELLFEYYPTSDTEIPTHHVYAMLDADGVLDPVRCDCIDYTTRRQKRGEKCEHQQALRLQVLGLTDIQVAA